MKELPGSLSVWERYPQFILCQGKVPVNPSGATINPHEPANWLGHEEACSYSELLGLGVGFVFAATDPMWFIDVDHGWDGQQWNPISLQFMEEFDGAAFEISTSGTGYHLFGCGTVPDHSNKNKEYGIELYTEGRFVLLTGNQAKGDTWLDWSHKLPWLVDSYFPPKATQISEDWRYTPVPEWNGITDDAVLITKLRQKLGFGARVGVGDLMAGTVEKLKAAYPHENPDIPYDRSSADMALASALAFWTGKHHERIRTIMRQSALLREKWNKHKTYLAMTISNAVNGCQNVYGQREVIDQPLQVNPLNEIDALLWVADFEVSEEEANKLSNPAWIIENLIIQGHLCVFPAEPNGGKTTIFFHLAGEMVSKGYDVYYVNADISGGDAKEFITRANKNGVKLLLPDMVLGQSMKTVVEKLQWMNQLDENFDNVVFIFDTLKKMTEVISKSVAKELYHLLRSLTAKGMTVILLAHTNKYFDDDGNPIYEGTVDLRADVDELIYLRPMKNSDGSLTVSTDPNKVRGNFKPITFDISKDRVVTQRDEFLDTKSSVQLAKQTERDRELIELVNNAIDAGHTNQKSIVDSLKANSSYGVRPIRRVLSSYSKQIINNFDIVNKDGMGLFWGLTHGDRNEYIYKKLIIVPEGEDERLYIARIAFSPENNKYLNSHELAAP